MTTQKRVVLTFEDDLTVSIEAAGFTGGACKQATAPYEEALGGVLVRRAKPEMAQSARQSQSQ